MIVGSRVSEKVRKILQGKISLQHFSFHLLGTAKLWERRNILS